MITINPYKKISYKGLVLNVYRGNIGEGLPFHEHKHSHASVCIEGKIKAKTKDKEAILDRDSHCIDLLPNKPHEIEILEDNTVFINIFLESESLGY
jgi:quercetin dioxygenase-like cupin family protein